MLLFRTTAAAFVDAVINHPDVRPTADIGTERLSSMSVLADHRNVCFGGEGGVVLFMHREDGAYEGHVFLVPGSRGATGLAFGKAALEALYGVVGPVTVVAEVPWQLPAARAYVRRLGFASRGRHPEQPVELFVMEAR